VKKKTSRRGAREGRRYPDIALMREPEETSNYPQMEGTTTKGKIRPKGSKSRNWEKKKIGKSGKSVKSQKNGPREGRITPQHTADEWRWKDDGTMI